VPAVGRTVLCLGLTSLFTDISSEMVSSVLPLYLVFFLGMTPLQFGVVDGLYQGMSALVRLAGGLAADRWRRHKELAAAGYALSAVCKLGLLAAGNVWWLLAIVFVDRTGKGIRTAPRDALISLSSPRAGLGAAFGVHRALDSAGALLGPLLAFALLARLPNRFDTVFVTSFCAAVVGLGVLAFFVENPPSVRAALRAAIGPHSSTSSTVSLHTVFGLLGAPRFRALVLVGAVLGLVTVADGFLYVGLQRRMAFATGLFPLLYVGTSFVYLLLALPAGWLADRVGRARVFIGGYALLVPVYLALLLPWTGFAGLVGCLLLFGAYYAATDGVLMAMGSDALEPELRTTGLGLLASVTSVARLLASVLFGAAWTAWGVQVAIAVFVAGLLAALILAAAALARPARPASPHFF
jgi:MFS family permease